MVLKRPQDLVQVGGDGDLIVEEILQPQVIVPLGQGDEIEERRVGKECRL